MDLIANFAHAHAQIRREFANPLIYAWFPATQDDDGEFTVPVAGQRGSLRAAVTGLAGMFSMATDGITMNALISDFPFPPVADVRFLIGPAITPATIPPTPAADLPCYRILTVTGADVLSHLHITAERVA